MKTKARVIENVIEILDPPDEAAFNRALNERVRMLRMAAGMTQAQAGAALGITVQAYQHFEYRSPMPAYLIPTFAALVGSDAGFVLTGEGGAKVRKSRAA